MNRDRTVNILDIDIIAYSFGTKEGNEHWNAACDMNNDAIVNVVDLSAII